MAYYFCFSNQQVLPCYYPNNIPYYTYIISYKVQFSLYPLVLPSKTITSLQLPKFRPRVRFKKALKNYRLWLLRTRYKIWEKLLEIEGKDNGILTVNS